MCRLISHGLNGLRKKGGVLNIIKKKLKKLKKLQNDTWLNMIAMQRISSLHLSTWMSFFMFHNARVPRKCGRFLK